MSFIKKKKTSKGKRNQAKFSVILSPLFFLFLLGLIFYIWLSGFKRGNSPILFEEMHSTSPELKEKIRLIDKTVYDSFYENGIGEQDIVFTVVKSIQEMNYEYDFTELLIKLNKNDLPNKVGDKIARGLQSLEPDVTYEKESLSGGEYIYHIYALGCYTHRIKFAPKYPTEIPKKYPRISIIIDDLGYDRDIADSIMDIDLPLSLSILPMAPYTAYVAKKAKENGLEILLHLPMEPKKYPYVNPGPGTLLMRMSEDEIRKRINELLDTVPGIIGVNHHMGSYFTESPEKMAVVLSEIKKRKLFYIDSRTTTRTVAYNTAKELGVPVANKSLFLDHDPSLKAIGYQMERLLGMARYQGTAVGIGHPHKETIEILRNYEKKLKKDLKIVPISAIVK